MDTRNGNLFCDFCGKWMNHKELRIVAPVDNNAAVICLPCVRMAAAQADKIEAQAGQKGGK
jgi:hypothetical protein